MKTSVVNLVLLFITVNFQTSTGKIKKDCDEYWDWPDKALEYGGKRWELSEDKPCVTIWSKWFVGKYENEEHLCSVKKPVDSDQCKGQSACLNGECLPLPEDCSNYESFVRETEYWDWEGSIECTQIRRSDQKQKRLSDGVEVTGKPYVFCSERLHEDKYMCGAHGRCVHGTCVKVQECKYLSNWSENGTLWSIKDRDSCMVTWENKSSRDAKNEPALCRQIFHGWNDYCQGDSYCDDGRCSSM